MSPVPVQTTLVAIADLVPYEFNPRNNEQAIAAVANSIREFGFLVPIVVDGNNVIVAGHTRWAAIKSLIETDESFAESFAEVPVIVAEHLTEDQLRAFRLIDNKTAEIATWDFDLLAQEISYLYQTGVDFSAFGWTQHEVDCLTSVVSADCLTAAEASAQFASDITGEGGGHGRSGSLSHTKDGLSVRITFGDLAFFVLTEDYRAWMDRRMKDNGFDPVAVADSVAESMGLLDAKRKRDQAVRGGVVTPETEEALDHENAAAPQPLEAT